MFMIKIALAGYVLCSSKLDGKALRWPVSQETDWQNCLQQNVSKLHLNTSQLLIIIIIIYLHTVLTVTFKTFGINQPINWLIFL